jgi:hypothetical protein
MGQLVQHLIEGVSRSLIAVFEFLSKGMEIRGVEMEGETPKVGKHTGCFKSAAHPVPEVYSHAVRRDVWLKASPLDHLNARERGE